MWLKRQLRHTPNNGKPFSHGETTTSDREKQRTSLRASRWLVPSERETVRREGFSHPHAPPAQHPTRFLRNSPPGLQLSVIQAWAHHGRVRSGSGSKGHTGLRTRTVYPGTVVQEDPVPGPPSGGSVVCCCFCQIPRAHVWQAGLPHPWCFIQRVLPHRALSPTPRERESKRERERERECKRERERE